MKTSYLFLLLGLLIWSDLFPQNAILEGVILNEQKEPVEKVSITTNTGKGVESNQNGFYRIDFPAGREITISISHLSYRSITVRVLLSPGEIMEFNPVLTTGTEQLEEVFLSSEQLEKLKGITILKPETVRKIPGANAGVENLLKTLPGVSSNNELSTQYSVRGGNYDENLVYVNGIEIYRPLLIRSGQQEGLSFINPDLVRKVHFSAGGFQAKYGDKLSSVLDISYRRPVSFGFTLNAGFLGASITSEGISKNRKFTYLTGLRYRDNSLFVNAKQTETNFHPRFTDVQTQLTYQFNDRFELSFLGNISLNSYDYKPETRQTNFGTLQDPKALLIYYSGQEKDQYRTWFSAVKASYLVNEYYSSHLTFSAYNTIEQEYFDIIAAYRLGEVNTDIVSKDFGKVEFSKAVGTQLTHARNKLDALIFNAAHHGTYKMGSHQLDYGLKFTHEDIKDRIREYEILDSAGFSIRPPLPDFKNNEPYLPFEAPLEPFQSIRTFNDSKIQRIQAFAQWSKRGELGNHEIWTNLGVRGHFWQLKAPLVKNSQFVFSPRGQFAIKPMWRSDMVFRASGGIYHQPPFYKEYRDFSGKLNPDVEAQRALHLVLGMDYSFKLQSRPFKLTSEVYYKDLSNVNPYTLENVRIRYEARNNSEAYAHGIDLRLHGEFVLGTESWLSLGYLKTEENREGRGYISRPTDQRLKFGLLFQDYVPKVPDLKMYLNLIYNTGLPGGSPTYADPYLYQTRLPDYRRADLGLSYFLRNGNSTITTNPKQRLKEVSIGFEIFNIFDTQNSITNTFVRDAYTKVQYAAPNYLSPRVFNLKVGLKL